MEYFISDTHFGHENILKESRGQFQTVEEMDEQILSAINKRVKKNDLLYILGDFSFRSKRSPVEYLEAIKGQKLLVVGNHDRDWLKKLTAEEQERLLVGVYSQYSVKRNGIELHMQHFPQLAWSRSHYFAQSFSICGHIHDKRDGTVAARLFPQVPCQFNAGVDVNGFEPVTLEELVRNNDRFYGRSYTEEERQALDEAIRKVML